MHTPQYTLGHDSSHHIRPLLGQMLVKMCVPGRWLIVFDLAVHAHSQIRARADTRTRFSASKEAVVIT
eukprot:3009826-Rhodomonas_salina.1